MVINRHNVETSILAMMYANPHESSRAIASELNISKSTVLSILHKHAFHPYRIHLHQGLHGEDGMRRTEFCMFLKDRFREDPDALRRILFSDEATFHRDGTVNRHNLHYWAPTNPFWLRADNHQIRWKVNVWCGVLDDRVIGPYFLDEVLTAPRYLQFLQTTLSDVLLDVLPLITLRNLWFQQDGAPPHNSLAVRLWLNQHFPGRWLGFGGPVRWPARSPDLNPLDYFLWGFVKAHVYDTCPENVDDLKDRIRRALALVTPQMLSLVRANLKTRVENCLTADGLHFEHLM